MRTEAEIREFYKDYVYRFSKAAIEGNINAALEYKGAAVACGRTLGKDLKRINADLEIAKDWLKRYGD